MSKDAIDMGRRRFGELLVLGTAAAALGWPASALAANSSAPSTVIKATNALKFVPAKVTVKAGDTVTWQNASVLVHTVTDDPAKAARSEDVALPEGAAPFNSGNIKPKGSFTHTFTVPGTYRYFCIPHEGAKMLGEVIVTP